MKQNDRYSRQILFSGIGEEGQRRLLASRVLIVGCGALGSAQAESLARAGVGRLRIADRDFIEYSNLQRQAMFTESDADNRLPEWYEKRHSRGKPGYVPSVRPELLVADLSTSEPLAEYPR